MRLLHFDDLKKLVSTDFSGKRIPPYAILSHRWDGDNEVLFEDLRTSGWAKKPGRKKIEFCAKQAAQDQLQYFWIDTCCIDKWNRRERSEAINSMFEWYKNAAKCYVFLPDVALSTPTDTLQSATWEASFRASEWFTRGWTLQELIAPISVEFFSREGERIGDKSTLEHLIHEITGLPLEVLQNSPLEEFTRSERMDWAGNRKTTEEEDSVYCLLGILNVSLTPSYGEGKDKALQRLQIEMESDSSSAPAIIPFAQNSDFVGRESELAELERMLYGDKPTGTIVIVGPGGTGKSQLALELAYKTRQKNKNCLVFWVDARDIDSLDQGYSNIAKKLDIPGWDDEKADAKLLVKHYLSREGTKQSLLILDNTESINLRSTGLSTPQTDNLTNYLPQSELCSIILTTINSDTAKELALENCLVQVVELGDMLPDTADKMLKNFLNHAVSTTEQHEVDLLLQDLSYLPLAIVQAAAYINTRDITLQDYRLQLVRRREAAPENSTELPKEVLPEKSPVATTLLISLDQILSGNMLAALYLFLAACLDQNDIPVDIVKTSSPGEKEGAIRVLSSYALITRRPAESAFDIHQLVHRELREWLKTKGRLDKWTQNTITKLLRVFPSHHHGNRSKWRRLLPHAKYILSHSLAEEDGGDRLKLVWKYAMALFSDGRFSEAEDLFVQVMETRKKKLGADHPDTLTSIANLASTYQNRGRWDAAQELFVQVIERSKKTLGADHPDTLSGMANLASTYRDQGRWDAAEELEVQIMETRKKKLGADHPKTLNSMANLASTLLAQGRWDAAKELCVQVMETRKTKLGPDHLDTLNSIGNLASTLWKQRQWDAAEELFVQVVETRKKQLGADHPDTLSSMANLASTYWKQGRCDLSEELEVQVMGIRKKKLGADHPDTLTSMNNLAFTWNHQDRNAEAITLMNECVQLRGRVLGVKHPDFKSSLKALTIWEAKKVIKP